MKLPPPSTILFSCSSVVRCYNRRGSKRKVLWIAMTIIEVVVVVQPESRNKNEEDDVK